ncbi:MAG: AMP-binding protein [Nocardia sp.]|nr:AMP-binding protein [Nocardia sp.]
MTVSPSDHRDGFVPFPAEVAESYRAAGYWTGKTLADLLRDTAVRYPDRPALITGDGVCDYAELDAEVDRWACGFSTLGMTPGDRVVLHLPNVAEFVPVLFGLLRAGIIPVLALPAHRRTEIEHLARLSGAVGYLIADRQGDFSYTGLAADLVAELPALRHVLVLGDPGPFTALATVPRMAPAPKEVSAPDIDPSDIALLLVSGGTTGLPKLIARTHDDYGYLCRASAEVCGIGPDDVYMATLPAAHNFTLSSPGIIGCVWAGAAITLIDDPSPENAFAVIERHRVTFTSVVPPLARLWCTATEWEQADLSSLRLLQAGGSKLAEVNAREVGPALGARLQQVFGMAEGLLNYTRDEDDEDIVCRTQGRPLSPADEIRIVDEEGNDVGPGEEGELLTRGPYTIRGYYRAPEHNARSFTPDGFYRSGDLVRRLPSGHLIVSGRIKDVINRGGENIACDEVEEHLLAHPAVRHAAAVGLPDPELGERTCAFLVVDGELPSLPALRRFLTDRGLAAFKLPDELRAAAALPVTAVGKIDKKALRAGA